MDPLVVGVNSAARVPSSKRLFRETSAAWGSVSATFSWIPLGVLCCRFPLRLVPQAARLFLATEPAFVVLMLSTPVGCCVPCLRQAVDVLLIDIIGLERLCDGGTRLRRRGSGRTCALSFL